MIPPLAVAAISVAVLAYEVLLVRLFAIVQWHHFAFMAISVALLGFGASGALLVLFQERVARAPARFFVLGAALFAVTAPAAFLVAQRVPFNALEIVWEPSQLLLLGLIYLVLLVPFTAGAFCIGLAFRAPGAMPGRVYFWNLLGSALGALGIVAALMVLDPLDCLGLVGGLGLVAALPAARRGGSRRALPALALLGAAGAVLWAAAPRDWTALRISEFKDLPRALAVGEARVVAKASGPLALLAVVESPAIPFRHAPGLSLISPDLPPPQLGVFADGEFAGAIDLWQGDRRLLGYLDHSTDALGYHLGRPSDVLVLGAGSGRPVLQALAHGAARVVAVEQDPELPALVRRSADHAAYDRPGVRTEIAAPRRFVDATGEAWDLIHLPATGGARGATARGLEEDFLMTVEGLGQTYRRLRPGGWLSATVEVELPPRLGLKLLTTLAAALKAAGVAEPREHLVAVRGLTTLTVAAKRGAVTGAEVERLRAFAARRGFDPVHHPGLRAAEANRQIRLAEASYFESFAALLGPAGDAFVEGYEFDIAPATDDRPYFHDVFKWAALPQLLALGQAGSAALLDLGELVVTGTLVQAALFGALLVLVPLRLRLRRGAAGAPVGRFGVYFTAIGLAFLFIEIAWIQRLVLFLGHPLYAVSVVLTGFLLFAALGAALSTPLQRRLARRRVSALDVAVAGILFTALAYEAVLPAILGTLAGLPEAARLGLSLALIAPLALCMGMPFPLGLARVATSYPDFVPWTWGLNGCASVVSAAAATLVSMHAGIPATVALALVLYLLAALALRPFGPERDAA